MNQWTKISKTFNWVNNYAKYKAGYQFVYMNNHELKFAIGKYDFIITYDASLNMISLFIYNSDRKRIFQYDTFVEMHRTSALMAVMQCMIEAFITGRGEHE